MGKRKAGSGRTKQTGAGVSPVQRPTVSPEDRVLLDKRDKLMQEGREWREYGRVLEPGERDLLKRRDRIMKFQQAAKTYKAATAAHREREALKYNTKLFKDYDDEKAAEARARRRKAGRR